LPGFDYRIIVGHCLNELKNSFPHFSDYARSI
jgi:hypothetical protein